MNGTSPDARDRAQRRVRAITMATAAGAGVLTLAGAAVTAGTFAGRTVATDQASPATPTQDAGGGLQQPDQPPGDGSGGGNGSGGAPITSGAS
jgi:hypothetical protein